MSSEAQRELCRNQLEEVVGRHERDHYLEELNNLFGERFITGGRPCCDGDELIDFMQAIIDQATFVIENERIRMDARKYLDELEKKEDRHGA